MERLHLNVLAAWTLQIDVLHLLSVQRPPRNGTVDGVASKLVFGRTPNIPFMVPIDVMHSEPQVVALRVIVRLHDLCPQEPPVEIAIINELVLLQSHYGLHVHQRRVRLLRHRISSRTRTRDIHHFQHSLFSLSHLSVISSASPMAIASLLFSGISVIPSSS